MAATVQVDSQILSFAKGVQLATGEDYRVVLAHWMSEEPIDSLKKWQEVGNNPAGIKKGNSEVDTLAVGQDANGFDQFYSPLRGMQAYVAMIKDDKNYQGVRDAIKTGDQAKELQAIADSPWDAGHYGGNGKNLFAAYNAITGANLQVNPQDSYADRADTSTATGQKVASEQVAQTNKQIGTFISNQLGLTTTPWELGVVVLGSIGILILVIMLVKPVGVPV